MLTQIETDDDNTYYGLLELELNHGDSIWPKICNGISNFGPGVFEIGDDVINSVQNTIEETDDANQNSKL